MLSSALLYLNDCGLYNNIIAALINIISVKSCYRDKPVTDSKINLKIDTEIALIKDRLHVLRYSLRTILTEAYRSI